MLKVIEDEKLIARYARQFAKSFRPLISEKFKVKLGHQGASFRAKVSWSKKLGIWIFSQTTKDVRYWNAFGIGQPKGVSHLPITAEINFSWTGIDRKTGAAFARDAQNRIYVVHRGKIGGGKKGIGKSLFAQNYRGVWAWMEDGETLARVAVVGLLESSRFALQTAHFVGKIAKLKSSASFSPQTSLDFSEISFREELLGCRPSSAPDDIIDGCDHDLIVSRLAAVLTRSKQVIGNDADTELFIVQPKSGKMSHVFAVCDNGVEKNVLAKAAQLLLQKAAQNGHPLAILILPEDEVIGFAQKLQQIQVIVLGCRLEGCRIFFPDLGKIRLDQNWQL